VSSHGVWADLGLDALDQNRSASGDAHRSPTARSSPIAPRLAVSRRAQLGRLRSSCLIGISRGATYTTVYQFVHVTGMGLTYDRWMSEVSRSTRTDADAPSTLFEQLAREPRLSDRVVEMMLETILSKRLKIGDRLPSERELGEQFGVSRAVIREAVRALVVKGVIEVRAGSGLRVAAVGPSTVSESMRLFLLGGTIDFEKVHEVRALLETHLAGMAAERAAPEDIDALCAVHRRMENATGDVEAAASDDLEFHRVIARATHNELYLILMDSIGTSLIDIRRANLSSGAVRVTLMQHALILDRITAHDPEGAREAMAAHLDRVAEFWRERSCAVASQPPSE
jgi:GntR family transcriptional regulator, transcriptional repressor for pyruvate dehydrogenase complex